jgi:ribosomal protein S18 acetylase RimI-like enzyme
MIKLIELYTDSALLRPLKSLLMEYGNYMFHDLGLIAGKKSFYEQIEADPDRSYQLPNGTFILAEVKGKIAGCVGIRRYSDEFCEMKRMYVRPEFRGLGIGQLMCSYVIERSKDLGYPKIYLDTNAEMRSAVNLYVHAGFKSISPYCINENPNPIFMEYVL